MISKIKEEIENQIGKNIKFTFNGARNQIEEFEGIIENAYNYIFIIRIKDENIVKSFTYSDILIKNLVIN